MLGKQIKHYWIGRGIITNSLDGQRKNFEQISWRCPAIMRVQNYFFFNILYESIKNISNIFWDAIAKRRLVNLQDICNFRKCNEFFVKHRSKCLCEFLLAFVKSVVAGRCKRIWPRNYSFQLDCWLFAIM